jgi:hypothetical protein
MTTADVSLTVWHASLRLAPTNKMPIASFTINVYDSQQYVSTTLPCFSDGDANWDGELKNPP